MFSNNADDDVIHECSLFIYFILLFVYFLYVSYNV